MLCYKYAAKQMIAQGHGGRIIGAEFSYHSLPHMLTRKNLNQGHLQWQANKVASICNMKRQELTHVLRAGASPAAGYSASKFAVRGLTQAAGMSFIEPMFLFVD